MKKILSITILLSFLVFYTPIKATDFPGSKTVVAYVEPNSGNPFYSYGVFGIDIGKKYDSGAQERETARTKYTFDLTSIPANATINSVSLLYNHYNWTNGSYKFKITQIGNYSSPQDIWSNIGQATALFSDILYGGTGSLNNATLTSLVNNSKGSYLYLGGLSQNEIYEDSWANLDIKLSISFSIPPTAVNITAKNNFEYGTIKVGVDATATQRNSPFPFSSNTGQTINLEAQNQPYGGYDRVWNNYMPNYQSNYQKQIGSTTTDLPNSQDISYSFSASTGDNNSYYIAGLRKNFRIDQTHKTEFDGNQTQQNTAWIVEQNNASITAPSSKTVVSNNYNFAGWIDDITLPTTRQINNPTDNQTYSALYKALHKSNSTTAYSNPSQRKFVQTPDGVKHICYESMNRVWIEHSTDNGATWFLGNGGKPLSSAASKNPSMSFYGNLVGIVWQEKSGSSFKIKTAAFWSYDYSSSLFGIVADDDPGLDYSHNANPVIAWGYTGKTIVVWSGTDANSNTAA